jgi:LytS/YehU family sensor histidine kinase
MYFREKKLVKVIAWFVACWIIYYFIYQFILKNAIPKIVESVLPGKYLRHPPRPAVARFYMGLLAVFVGGFSSTAFAAGFKYLKQWYLKEQRNAQLQKENTEAQLQLLTAQVHPHFLFNTLNNIYSQAQEESARGSKMIMGLSDMLRYILLEGKKPLVPLDKELQIIKECMHLEKNRYGDKLDLHYLIADTTNDLYIAPLLLLPFIENCFRYSVNEMPEDPWINLTIELKNTSLSMKLLNGTTANGFEPHSGIGLTDVKQRLELLYKDRYDLQTRDDEVFIVDLKVELVKLEATNDTLNQTTTGLLYA